MTVLHYVDFGPTNPANPTNPEKTVVFLGSIASTVDMWLPQLNALAAENRVIAIDHRGHGLSPDPTVAPGETTITDLAQDVLDTLDDAGVSEFIVVGLSLGGAVAQYLAANSDRVKKAAFLCTASYFGGPEKWNPRAELTRAEGIAPMADAVVGLWLSSAFATSHPATNDALRRMILTTRGTGYASCSDALAKWDFTEELAKVQVPVLTIAGPDDASTPPEVVHAIGQATAGPATAVTLSAGAHVPTVEVPEEVTQALREFIAA
ncbi:alpha/beta fold hydrolase [Corynebacterium riegelii]|uniref:alpha/beta fold hydrolase n=1 Tax=Corynebacterium riegelii TaxID=156976 RepID=UPI00288916DA|nr:alpha/beta fold hydrolase [Corynebacterium riegelii]